MYLQRLKKVTSCTILFIEIITLYLHVLFYTHLVKFSLVFESEYAEKDHVI